MVGVSIKMKDGFGKFLGKFAGVLRGKEREAEEEVSGGMLAEARSEEEEALYAAMGWDGAAEGNEGEVVRGKVGEALNSKF